VDQVGGSQLAFAKGDLMLKQLSTEASLAQNQILFSSSLINTTNT
jgi:hypothetical protein